MGRGFNPRKNNNANKGNRHANDRAKSLSGANHSGRTNNRGGKRTNTNQKRGGKFRGPGNGNWKNDRAPDHQGTREKKMLEGMDKGMDNYWNKDPETKAQKLTGDLEEYMNQGGETAAPQ
jgi:hypothetical protein